MASQLLSLDDKSFIEITPVVKDGSGNSTNVGQPIRVTLAELVAYLQTKTGWQAT